MIEYEESNTCGIPEDWKEKIYRDGCRKKVIVYDTNMVSPSELRSLITKIKSVIEYFEGLNDALLLWRPNPLLHTVLAIEDKQLLKEYEDMVEQFRKNRNGIFDDTTDFRRAIDISDAYFGDKTFLLSLYRQTWKPIMLQNILNYRNTRNVGNLYTEAIVWEGNTGWFFQGDYNALFEVEWKSGKCRFLASVPGERMCKRYLYAAIAKYKDCLVLVPYMADEIAIYDIGLGTFLKLPLKQYGNENLGEKFADFVVYGKHIFLIPTYYPAIVRLDTETLELTYLEACIELLEGCRVNPSYLLNIRPVVREDTFWVGCYAANYLLEFNMKTLQYTLHKIENCQGGIAASCYDGTFFWIVQFPQLKIISWNPVSGEERVFDSYPEGFQGETGSFLFVLYDNDRVLFLPEHANMILEIDPKSGCIHGKKKSNCCSNERDILYWTCFQLHGDNYYVTGDGRIVKLDVYLQEEEVLHLHISQEEIEKIGQMISRKISEAILAGESLMEYSETDDENSVLESYIKSVVPFSVNKTVKEENMTNGRKLYEYIKEHSEMEVLQ